MEAPVNGVGTTLASPYITSTSQLTAVISSATAFPSGQYRCLINDGVNFEIVSVLSKTGSTLTLGARAVESYNGIQTAFTFGAGATIQVVTTVGSVANLIQQATAAVTNAKGYGVTGNAIQNNVGDGHITSGAAIFTSASGVFAATDVGKTFVVYGAGASGAPLSTTILTYTSATQVTLNANAGTTVTTGKYLYGTDDTTAIVAAGNAVVAAGGGILSFPPGVYIVNNAVINALYTGTLWIQGSGRGTTTFIATTASTNSTINLVGNAIVTDATFDGGAVSIQNLLCTTPNGQTADHVTWQRVTCQNVSTTVGQWVGAIWGQTTTGGYNVTNAFLYDVELLGPSCASNDAFAVSGVTNCYVDGLYMNGLSRTPNFYTIGHLYANNMTCTNTTGNSLVIDNGVAHCQVTNLYVDGSGNGPIINSPEGTFTNCRFEYNPNNADGVTLNLEATRPNLKFINCFCAGYGLEGPMGSLEIIGGEIKGAGGCIIDYSPASTVHGPITIRDAILNPTSYFVESFNVTSGILRISNCHIWSTGRVVYDGVTTITSETITSATANFTTADVGRSITDGGTGLGHIPAATTISSVTNATTAVMSANATASGTVDVFAMGGLPGAAPSNFQFTLLAGSKISDVMGYNPVGSSMPSGGTAFAIGATTVLATNNTGVDGTLYCTVAGTVTAVQVNGVTVQTSLAVGETFRLVVGGTLKMTYSSTPTLVFVGD